MIELSDWLQESYCDGETLLKSSTLLKSQPLQTLQLQHFFQEQKLKEIYAEILRSVTKKKYIPNQHSYRTVLKIRATDLLHSFLLFCESPLFTSYVSFITKKEYAYVTATIKIFSAGDYKVIHDMSVQGKAKVLIDCTPVWNQQNGGYYGLQKEDETLIIAPCWNSITLCADSKVRDFVKYITHHAKKEKRVCIELLYE